MKSDQPASKASEWKNTIVNIKKSSMLTFIAIVLFILILPRFGFQYASYLMLTFFGYGVAVLGWNLLFGYTGLLSFGHALFFAVGAYTLAFLMNKFSIFHMEAILVIAVIISGALAALVGAICIRYTRVYFGMLTLAFNMLLYSFLLKFYYITGGDEGMNVSRPYLLGVDFLGIPKMQFLTGSYYYYAWAVLVIATLIMYGIVSSPFGHCLKAIRDNPEKATYLGIDIKRYRWYAFIISGIYTAIGGVLVAPVVGLVDPSMAYWTHSGTFVFMALLGGFVNFLGPLLGAVLYIFLQDTIMSLLYYWRFVFGAMLAFIVIAAPGGITGFIDSLMNKDETGG